MSDCDPASLPFVPGGGVSALPALVETQPGVFTRERQVAFLHALAATGAIRSAAGRAGVSHQTAYRARLAEPLFRRAWDAALLAARCHAEEVLSCRAIDGVEEQVWYHGEEVATRRRYDSRLLLAHLARLDRLTADTRVDAFAGDFEAALGRFGEGSEAPEVAPPKAPAPEKKKKTPGPWSKRSKAALENPCPDCGGRCLGPEDDLTRDDCQWFGNRLRRMNQARPRGVKEPHQFGLDTGDVEMEQLAAFEAGVERWWLVAPPGPDDDPDEWHFAG